MSELLVSASEVFLVLNMYLWINIFISNSLQNYIYLTEQLVSLTEIKNYKL